MAKTVSRKNPVPKVRIRHAKQTTPVRPSFVREVRFIPRNLHEIHVSERFVEQDTPASERAGGLVRLTRPLLKPALLRCAEQICRRSRLEKPRDGSAAFLHFAEEDGDGGGDEAGPSEARWDRARQCIVFRNVPEDWCAAVGGLASLEKHKKQRRASVAAGDLHGFFQLHGPSAEKPLQKLFTDVYVEATDAVRRAQRNAADGWGERVRKACFRKDLPTLSLLLAKTYRSAEPDVPLQEDEEGGPMDAPLPLAFQSAMTELAKRRDRFPNGGRAILSSGSRVVLRGAIGPVVGVPVALAMRVTQEQAWTTNSSTHLARLVASGPCRHPGAHYIVDDTGRRRYVPDDGFCSAAEAKTWMGTRVRLVGRHIVDGDYVGLTRSPVVAPHNHMYFRAKIVSGFTLRPHDVVLKPYDADYDGDGMILYIPRDLVAAEQWRCQLPGRLLTYQSGGPAMELMLDGLLGLARKPRVSRKTLVALASVLPGLRLLDLQRMDDGNKGDDNDAWGVADVLGLCAQAAGAKAMKALEPSEVARAVRVVGHHEGVEAAMGLLFNAQNVGAELARAAELPAFGIFDFISPPALHEAQKALFQLLEEWLHPLRGSGTTERRRDEHEVVVSFTEPFAGRGPLGYNERVLMGFAETGQQMARGSSEGMQSARAVVQQEPATEETYLTADLALKIKTPVASAALATGVPRGTISEQWRNQAAVAWPEEQPSLMLSERTANYVSEVGATIQAIHGIEGLSGKGVIEKAGEMRNNATSLLSDLRRDASGILRGPLTGVRPGERCALMTARAMPVSLWAQPAAIMNNKPVASSSSIACPWVRTPPRRHFEAPSADQQQPRQQQPGAKVHADVVRWLESDGESSWGLRQQEEETQEEVPGAQLDEDAWRRRFSGILLPVLHAAVLNGIPQESGDDHPPWAPPSPLCPRCKRGVRRFQQDIGKLRCTKCHEDTVCERGAVICCRDTSNNWASWAPSTVEYQAATECCRLCRGDVLQKREVRRPCTRGGGGWSVYVCCACGQEEQKHQHTTVLYSRAARARHRRAAWGSDPEHPEAVPFLRVELDERRLLAAGFTELAEFELLRVLDTSFPTPTTHSIVGWGAPSIRPGAPPVVVLHTFGSALLEHMAALPALCLGYDGFSLADGGLKQDDSGRLRATLHCTGAPGALPRMKALLRGMPPGTRATVAGDYPASLAIEGPEAALRRMVDDHVGTDAGMAATARVLASRRTWGGDVLSCKSRDGGVWRLLGLSPAEAFRQLADGAYRGDEQNMEGAARWLGRLEEVGVASVLLLEDSDTKTPQYLRAEQFNRSHLPPNLTPGPPQQTSSWLTFEERSKSIGIRALQLILNGCDEDPLEKARRELSDGELPFSVLRSWGGCAAQCELVRLMDLR